MSGRSDRIRELYEAALKRPIGERPSFIASQTKDDRDLRQRVEALLKGQHDTQIAGYESTDGDSALLAAGTVIGQYRIDGPLGAGGMGVVYRATDTKLNRPAAIKVLPDSLADSEARRRFQREAQMASSLNHPHIVTVYDAGEYRERQYLVTEYVDGGTLRQWAGRPHGWRAIVELLVGVADAVAVAHEAGILHRDIKPENILLAKSGYAKLADFGLAKLLELDPLADDAFAGIRPDPHSSQVGTAAYMSPEQAQGLPLDARSDVYSFGLVLHELLSGERPSVTRSLESEHGADAEALAPLRAEVPVELRTIVGKAVEHEPGDRYQTMRELVVDLRRLARHSASESRPRLTPYLWTAVAALALLAVGAYFVGTMSGTGEADGVAVLPFANETGSPTDGALSEGLGDGLRDRLMELPGLEVQARASSVSFRNQTVDSRTIADTLGVGRLVNGSLRRNGKMLEVLVEVLDAEGFAVAPSFRYEELERDFQVLQQKIAADVSALLMPDAGGERVAKVKAPTDESERANMFVTIGRQFEYEVKSELTIDEAKLDVAIDLYSRATQADPESVAAHGRLAGALLYKGDVESATRPLLQALELGNDLDPDASADLSYAYFSYALYLLRTGARGADEAYRTAIELNPNNADALGGYAQWLLTHRRPNDADEYFREAIEHDRQSVARYSDYAEALGTKEDMEGVSALAHEIADRFPDARGDLALARVYEIMGDLDIGIAYGLRAYRAAPQNPDNARQVAELYARIGEFDKAIEFESSEPVISLFWLRQKYAELIDFAGFYVIDHPDDLDAKQFLAFAHNATGDFALARIQLEDLGMAPSLEFAEGVDPETVQLYVDALQGLGEYAVARRFADASANTFRAALEFGHEKSWWSNTNLACAEAQLGRDAEARGDPASAQARFAAALAALERVRKAEGLVWTPRIADSVCFQPIAHEPGYEALLAHLEQRQQVLRDRLPATLIEYGVADVRP
jgi:serine/threonine protein kinase/TolB-like protein/thioredoxin-like negative regulator of GroEL